MLLGPSGSGVTLLNPRRRDVPTSGEVVYNDRSLTRRQAALTAYTARTWPVFQFTTSSLPDDARERGARPDLAESNGPTPPAMVGLDHRLDHFPSQMSGGEQQRVAIARAIAKRPQILLCDEPTGALDVETGKLVLAAIARVNRELGSTTVVITHNAVIADMADRVLQLADGRVTADRHNTTKRNPAELAW